MCLPITSGTLLRTRIEDEEAELYLVIMQNWIQHMLEQRYVSNSIPWAADMVLIVTKRLWIDLSNATCRKGAGIDKVTSRGTATTSQFLFFILIFVNPLPWVFGLKCIRKHCGALIRWPATNRSVVPNESYDMGPTTLLHSLPTCQQHLSFSVV